MLDFEIVCIKIKETFVGSLENAIERAIKIQEEYQPSFGVQIEINEKVIWDSEEC